MRKEKEASWGFSEWLAMAVLYAVLQLVSFCLIDYRIADILPRMDLASLYATFGASSLITTAAFALIFLLPHFLRQSLKQRNT